MRLDIRGFISEARRRKVFSVLAVYFFVSLTLLTAAEYVFPALLLPAVANRLLAILLLFGFPVAAVLAWAYDVTSDGVKRTEPLLQTPARQDLIGPTVRSAPRPRPEPKRITPQRSVESALTPPDPARLRRASLAQIRHDLRTPINAIVGYSEMLLEDGEWGARVDLREELASLREASADVLARIDAALDPDAAVQDNRPAVEAMAGRLPADLLEAVPLFAQRARTLTDRAIQAGLTENVPDLERIAAAAARLRSKIEQLSDGGLSNTSERQIEQASAVARDVLAAIQPIDNGELDVHEGRLLVVDDHSTNRDLLARQLARQGYSVVTVGSGQEALNKLSSQEFDLVLLDVLMPGMNGLEVLTRIKENPDWAEVPVIMISALDEVDSVVRCIELGAEDYVAKPFNPVLLTARIRSNLRMRHVRRLERAYSEELQASEALNTRLLASVAPAALASRVAAGASVIDFNGEATALFVEVDGLPHPGNAITARAYVTQLNGLFLAFDALAERAHVTLSRPQGGHAYVALLGMTDASEHDPEAMANLALEFIAETKRRGSDDLHVRIGMHTGPALIGALAADRIRVHVAGDAIDVAQSLAEQARPDTVHVSTPVYLRLRDRFTCENKGVTALGPDVQMRTFVLAP
jgi:adenylate cyclase